MVYKLATYYKQSRRPIFTGQLGFRVSLSVQNGLKLSDMGVKIPKWVPKPQLASRYGFSGLFEVECKFINQLFKIIGFLWPQILKIVRFRDPFCPFPPFLPSKSPYIPNKKSYNLPLHYNIHFHPFYAELTLSKPIYLPKTCDFHDFGHFDSRKPWLDPQNFHKIKKKTFPQNYT